MFKDDLQPPKSNYFGKIITALKWCGVGLEDIENPREAIFFKIYSLVISSTIFYYIIAEGIDLALHLNDFAYFSFSLSYVATQSCGVLKGIILYVNRKEISTYFKDLESGFFAPNIERGGTEENKFINRAIKYSNFQVFIIYCLVVVIVANHTFSAIFDTVLEETFDSSTNQSIVKTMKVLPYKIYLPIDTQKYYNWTVCYQVYSCLVIGFCLGACDALITGIIMHVKAQILILRNSLFRIKERAYEMYEKSNGNVFNRNVEPLEKLPPEIQANVTLIFGDVIQHHCEIINLVDETENKFNILLLVQFLVSLMVMCTILFQLSLFDINSPEFFSMASYLALMLFQLLMYCWNGNELSLESLDVARAAFDSEWIQLDNNCQKALVLIMLRAQRALRLSAGKFAFLSLETYTTILRGSFSYYLAIRTVNEE